MDAMQKAQRHCAREGRSRTAGMTLVEMTISMMVIVVAVGATLSSLSSSGILGDAASETSQAYLAAQQQLEALKTEEFALVFARHNADPNDDPDGPGTAPGSGFAVAGLNAGIDDTDGMVGRIVFPTRTTKPAELPEDLDAPEFGMPRDLNADGVIDRLNHANDYELLPVSVRIEWRGASGNRTVELQTLLTDG